MGKVIMSGIVPQLEEPFSVDAIFANNDWSKIIEACQKGKVPDSWVVGDQKAMTINGTDYLIDIIGKNHDTYSDGSGKAPLTFQLHDCYGTQYNINDGGTNSMGWVSCKMRTTTLPTLLALMPVNVQSRIKAVNKLTAPCGGANFVTAETTADKLFLLSEFEVWGSNGYSLAGEGTQYAYYAAGNSKIKKINNSAITWWERSPTPGNQTDFAITNSNGNPSCSTVTYSFGVSFAFCF